jgi:hypothetical protein
MLGGRTRAVPYPILEKASMLCNVTAILDLERGPLNQ